MMRAKSSRAEYSFRLKRAKNCTANGAILKRQSSNNRLFAIVKCHLIAGYCFAFVCGMCTLQPREKPVSLLTNNKWSDAHVRIKQ